MGAGKSSYDGEGDREREERERNIGNREEGKSPGQLKGTFLILNAYFTNLLWQDET